MGNKNKSIMVLGSTIIAVISIILIYVLLISTGVIVGREYTLKIEAVDIVKVYDGKPLNQSTAEANYWHVIQGQDLLDKNGHYLEMGYESVEGGDLVNAGSTEFILVPMVKEIGTGADVTSKYNIETTKGHLVIQPRDIIVRTYNYSKTYDGEGVEVFGVINKNSNHYYSDVLKKELVRVINQSEVALPGHQIEYEVSCSISEIGSANIEVSILNVTVDSSSESLEGTGDDNKKIPSQNYRVVYENDVRGQIEILPIYLNVKTSNQSVVYNGNNVTSKGFYLNSNLSSKLLPGHRLVENIESTFSQSQVGEYIDDQYTFKIVDSQGNDVSHLYGIDPNSSFGVINIQPIKLTIQTNTITKTYDGNPFDENEIKRSYDIIGSPAQGHTIKVTFEEFENFINAGEKENKANIVILDKNGEDVTSNYLINEGEDITGKFIIEPIILLIETYSKEKLFDGTPLYGKDVFSDIPGEENKNYKIIVGEVLGDGSTSGDLLAGHKITVELNSSITQAGSVDNNITSHKIVDSNGNVVTNNYIIDSSHIGKLEILKPQLSFKTLNASFEYNGNVCKLTDLEGVYDLKEDVCDFTIIFPENWNLPTEWDWEVESFPEEINVCEKENKPRLKIYNKATGQLLYDDGTGFTRNFDITYEYGTYSITPKTLYFETASSSSTEYSDGWVYNGQTQYIKEFINKQGLLEGHFIDELNAKFPELVDATLDKDGNIISILNEPEYRILDKKGNDVTKNYDASTVSFGSLKIYPIDLSSYSGIIDLMYSKIYDGTPYDRSDLENDVNAIDSNIKQKLLSGHFFGIDFDEIQNYVNAGEYKIEGKIYFGNKDVTNNYILPSVIKNGKLVIEPIKVKVSTGHYEFTYGNIPENFEEFRILDVSVTYLDGTALPSNILFDVIFEKEINNNTSVNTKGIQNKVSKIIFRRDDIDIDIEQFNRNVDIDHDSSDYQLIVIHPITINIELMYDNNERTRTKYYDGTPFVPDESWYQVISYMDKDGIEILSLPEGHIIEMNTKKINGHINAKTYENDLAFEVMYNGHSVTNNYRVNTGDNPGSLIIKPISIYFYSDNARVNSDYTTERTFNGEPLYGENIYLDYEKSEGLPGNWIIYPNADNYITDVQFKNGVVTRKDNKCTYAIEIDGIILSETEFNKLINNGNIVETFETGYIKLNQFSIPFQTAKSIGAFDNTVVGYYWPGCDPLSDSEIVYQFANLMDEQEFYALLDRLGATVKVDEKSIIELSTLSDVSKNKKDNKIKLIIKNETTGVDYTNCFYQDRKESYLWLKQYQLTISTQKSIESSKDNIEVIYTGQAIFDNKLWISDENLDLLTSLNLSKEDLKVVNYKTFVDAGTHKNELEITVNGNPIKDLFDVVYAQKDIVIKKKEIQITVSGEQKTFDGNGLSVYKDEVPYVFESDKQFIEDYGFNFEFILNQEIGPYAGSEDLDYSYRITKDGVDVTDNFKITNKITNKEKTKLIINPYELKLVSVSDSQTYKENVVYNKERLTEESYKIIETLESYGFVVTISWPDREITEIGEYENSFEVIVTYNDIVISNTAYKDSIKFDITFGKIVVNEKRVVPGSKPVDSEPSDNEPENVEVFKVKSDQVGKLYLRSMSYGDYDGIGYFNEVNNVTSKYSSLDYNPYFTPASVLKNSISKSTVYVDMTAGNYSSYLYPYYSELNPDSYDDTYISDNIGEVYKLNYYSYNNRIYSSYPTTTIDIEYLNYVYEQYTSLNGVSSELQMLLSYFISSNGLNESDPEIIDKVRLAMTSFGEYSYDVDYSNSTDVVAEFLIRQKGVCRHYAKTATLVYRMLGIPARYTVGAMVNISRSDAQSGRYVSVKDSNLHAWVEVFIDGFGWVPIEVTKSMDAVDKDSLVTLMPSLKEVQYYYGMENVVLDEIEFQSTSSEIYRVEGVITGSTNVLGEHQTYIESYQLFDKYGNDITKYYNVTTLPGQLIIYSKKIEINVASASKEYDGTALVCHDILNKDSLDLLPGHRLNDLNLITFTNSGEINVGVYINSILKTNLIVDENGNDVTSQYYIMINPGQLEISKRSIRLRAESYDFTSSDIPNGDGEYRYNDYTIISGLLDGHTITNLEMDENSYVDGIDVFEALNKIDVSSIVIKDSEGNEVQDYYSFIATRGYLNYYEE